MTAGSTESVWEMRDGLLEILRLLNRAEMEEPEGEGLEPEELARLLGRRQYPRLSEHDLGEALAMLVANGFAAPRDDRPYAWDRGRPLGHRFTITTAGKGFLIARISRADRVN